MRRCSWFAVVLVACGPSTPPVVPGPAPAPVAGPVTPAPAPAPAGPTDAVRLGSALTVVDYDLALAIDPDQPTFAGTMVIHAQLAAPTGELVVHAERLAIVTATIGTTEVTTADLGNGRLRLASPTPIAAGPVTITIRYTGVVDDTDTMGVFRQQDRQHWYVFTQFEALGARRAFPCIDEPAVKVPWKLSITVPRGMTAVGNALVAAERDTAAGHTFEFAPTVPLPSYLVAFGVGPFDLVDAGTTASGKPIRIVAPAGRAAEAKVAAEITPKVIAYLESWFGMPYPYPKIDAMAIPITVAFGAMENAGLITYRADLLLMPETAPESRKRRYAGYCSHEMSHQWFGDLVTPAWWDDLWLNESFASWLPQHLFPAVFPSWTSPGAAVEVRGVALRADSLGSARRVRQPIASENDIITAFDRITYNKGAAVLRMFELWAGEEKFQTGVRAYLTAHANGNATAHDFLAAVTTSTGADITSAMSTFLDQPGVPRLAVELSCTGDKATFTVSQSRYLPIGAEPAAATASVWQLPVCVVYGAAGHKAGAAGARREVCQLVTTPTATIEADGCGAGTWFYPNLGGRGYYHTAIAGSLATLEKDGWRHLDAAERLSVAQDVTAAIAAGELDVTAALELIPLEVADGSRVVVEHAVGTIGGLRRFLPADDPAIAKWIRKQLGPLARKLGWKPVKGEDVEAMALREGVVSLVAELGADPKLRKQAVALAKNWRALPEGGVRGDVLRVAARANPALVDRWRDDYVAETSRVVHTDLAVALGRVADRARVEASLALLLDKRVDIREANLILLEATSDPVTQPWAEDWVVTHLDELIARYPEEGAVRLVDALTASCDPARVEPMRAVADAKIVPLKGGPRRVQQAFEGLTQCVARRHALEPSLAAWRKTLR